jgi:hypothetical protein
VIARFCIAAAITLSLSTLSAAQPRTITPVSAELEALARDIVVLGPGEFLHGLREPALWLPAEAHAPLLRFRAFLENRSWRAADVVPLFKHPDPRVRTLALVAAYATDDPKLLPAIDVLVDDAATTFPAAQPHSAPPMMKIPSVLTQQTVGQIATAIVRVYMESGGFYYGPRGLRGQPGFDAYWKPRASRTSTAGWWMVRLARVGHSSSPTMKDRVPAIRSLRVEIDRLPQPDRTYILLWLHREMGSEVLASEDELIEMARRLGADNLVDVLRRNIRSDDPDLQPSPSNNHRYAGMCLFILQHADVLLRSGDATALLDQETWERGYLPRGISDPLISSWWAIAAAQLRPASSASILDGAYSRFQDDYQGGDRLELATARWRLSGDGATALNWFYAQLPRHMGMESHYFDRLMKTPGRSPQSLAKLAIAHPMFDELNWKSLEVLARAMNGWLGREVVTEDELESTWSPGGVDFFYKDVARARAEYPKETAEFLSRLARWRQQIRSAAAGL